MGHLLACKSAASACPTTIAATPAAAEAAATKTTRESNTMMVPPILNLIIDQESGAQSAAAIATSPPPVLLPPIKQRETAARKKRARQDEGDLLIFDSPVKVVSAAASSSSPPEVSTKLQTILSNADYESPASFFNKSPKETLSSQSSSGFCDSGYYGALEDCALVTDLNNSASSGSSNSVCGSSESCEKILNAKSDCDCKKCLNDELLRIKKEIFFMYKQHQVVPNVLHHHHPSSQAVAPFSKHHHHHHQHFLHHGKRIIDFGPASTKTGIVVVEEEFEDDEFLVSTTQQDNFDKGRRSVKLNRLEDDDAEERKGGARSRRSGLETKLSSSLSSANGGIDQNETSVHMTTTTRNGDLQKPRRTHIIENELFAEHEEEEEGLEEEESASNAERSVFLTRHSWSSELKPSSNSNKVQQQVVIEGNEATSLLLNSLGTGETTPIKKPQKKSAKTMRVIKSGGSGEEVSTPTTSQSSPNSHRMKRFEQFLKSLVGKKPSSGSTTSTNSSQSHSHSQKNGSTESRIVAAQVTSQAAPQVLKIDPSPSEEGNLQASFYRQHSSGSTTSLNLIAQQKFLNILPLPKRNMSVNNLTVIPEAMQRRSIGVAMATSGPECLKTNSCSFSNFEKLTATIKNEFDTNLDMRGGGGGRQGLVAPGNRRLQVSRSTNFLQSPAYLSAQLGALPIRPLNRFRNSLATSASLLEVETSEQCSRCSSLLSLAGGAGGTGSNESRASLNLRNSGAFEPVAATVTQSCKLCLGEVKSDQMTLIHMCQCTFCTDCMKAYIEFEILEGAYEISCPDAMCPSQGMLSMSEIGALATPDLLTKHHRYRLNREVEMDKNRVWCPKAGCDTVCLLDANMPSSSTSSFSAVVKSNLGVPHSVKCPTCSEEFCSACKKTWHPRISCEENTKRLAADGLIESIGIPFDNDLIKCCPMCCVPIEKDEGCAQMMCKRCKHVFCWYCLASLDDDFLLRHYDKGPCKNKLGHSRASVVWHRAQVIGIFAGFGLLLLVASPLLLLAAPCIVCCKCRICSGAAKLEEEQDIEFEDPINTLHSL